MSITRKLHHLIESKLKPAKVCLLFGVRRVGKTVLIKNLASKYEGKTMLLNGEDYNAQQLLSEQSIANYKRLFENTDLLIIDEAQAIPKIGQKLKLMVDEISHLKIIATGSSAFDLLNKSGEPLTGRSYTFYMHPIAQSELREKENLIETKGKLEERLIFGSYPEVITMNSLAEKEEYLKDLVVSYLLKDILIIDGIRNSSKMLDLLKLIAYQVGNEVSYDELGKQLGMSKNTVEKYLDLLTKVFILKKLSAYSGNLRKEISKNTKWYFTDNGVRNALIGNFQPLALRNDVGALWENYIINERIKFLEYTENRKELFFWRTYDHQEIDWVELKNEKLEAFEFKWNNNKKTKAPEAWTKNYPEATFTKIDTLNYLDWIGA